MATINTEFESGPSLLVHRAFIRTPTNSKKIKQSLYRTGVAQRFPGS
jgi:N-acetylmuramoyl-L-alanine amidase